MLELYKLDERIVFPAVEFALDEPNGLLAFGGDLSSQRLLHAYRNGIFPWFGDGEPFLWWSPDPRGILKLQDFHASTSLQKRLKKTPFVITINHAFEQVIEHCSHIPRDFGAHPQIDTWITTEMLDAYVSMHTAGLASSIEVWLDNELVGGLYGVCIGGVFCGESMFHKVTDASKVALLALVSHMKSHNMGFIDCQMNTEHLSRLGCTTISRTEFKKLLDQYKDQVIMPNVWSPQHIKPLL